MIWKGQREEKACSHQKKRKRKKRKKERKKERKRITACIKQSHCTVKSDFWAHTPKGSPGKERVPEQRSYQKLILERTIILLAALVTQETTETANQGGKTRKKVIHQRPQIRGVGVRGGGGGEEKGCSSETRNQRPKRPPSDNSIVEGLYSSCVPINRLFVEVMSKTNWLKIKSKICLAAMCCQLPHVTCKILLFYF